ncbi:GNAT family N-acetyltransferase [Allobranchiibius huperziae]|uniref:GNAT superfamily N-acetyltransferase n=1 Tax=Allobranchiibius huperziae TaxID=1874116 RepID=A0A853DKD1_9MICO|nr:GNAT superfamily N-acetyltransferase [Allobranchiibius huperziae]
MTLAPDGPTPELPDRWSARPPAEADVAALVGLRAGEQQAARGESHVDEDAVRAEAIGPGSWTRRQLVVTDQDDVVRGWASVHDRAAGRTNIAVFVDRSLPEDVADSVAGQLYSWCRAVAGEVAAERGETRTQLDAGVYDGDAAQTRWLTAAGLTCTRIWLQMSRPVTPDEGEPGAFPPLREGVVVRRVAEHTDGTPVGAELRAVHQILEESFEDHFNSYRESFGEFVQRLREDPGHRWDHWWIATVDIDGTPTPGGALVGTVLPPDDSGIDGSYIDYIGVHRRARGRGVAKGLLHAVIADAASRGRNRVDLEVDADSPTQADGLYLSMGWVTKYRTQSWHRDIDA